VNGADSLTSGRDEVRNLGTSVHMIMNAAAEGMRHIPADAHGGAC